MRFIAFVLIAVAAFVAAIGGGKSTFGQSFVVSSGGGSLVVSSRLDAKMEDLQRDMQELKATVMAMQAEQQKPVIKPIKIVVPEIKPVAVVSTVKARSQSEIAAGQHLRNAHGISVSGKSLAEMEVIHDNAHGGTAYHFPGMPSLNTAQVMRQQVRTVSRVSNCPGGVCPTNRTFSRVRYRRR